MDYIKDIMRILQWATVEEAYMVLRFAENVVMGERKTGGEEEETGKMAVIDQRRKGCRGIHN